MSTLAPDQPVGTDLPMVALVRILLAPAVSTLCLTLTLLAFDEPYTTLYAVLSIVAFLVTIWAFGELPLAGSRQGLSLWPSGFVLIGWLKVIGVLLFVAFATKASGLYSRKLILLWFAATPFAIQIAQEIARGVHEPMRRQQRRDMLAQKHR